MIDALDKWDSLSEKELQAGLDKIEKYVELVEQEQKHVETQQQHYYLMYRALYNYKLNMRRKLKISLKIRVGLVDYTVLSLQQI